MKSEVMERLHEEGVHFTYRHWRITGDDHTLKYYQRKESTWMPQPKGGYTECVVWVGEGDERERISIGWALCSEKDNFCYRVGRQIAKGRALKAITLTEDGELVASSRRPLCSGTVEDVRMNIQAMRTPHSLSA